MDIGSDTWVKCKFSDCYQCCLETEMLLTSTDIININSLDYSQEKYSFENQDGFNQLRNIESKIGTKCFFLNDSGKCNLVVNKNDHRPQGCKIYPLIVDLNDNTIRIDDDCRETKWFESQTYLKGQSETITGLIDQLLKENEKYKES